VDDGDGFRQELNPSYMLCGVRARITSLAEYFPRIRKAYLIGEAAQEFAATLQAKAPYEISETLDVAVTSAARDAEASGLPDPVVLLSPACASFDQYRNFEIRGARFRDLVTALPGVKPVV
jgi:UDP-N-acetylmuramoylalanine--D-glutamate ligase